MQYYLGVEFGSTRIKAVALDDEYKVAALGDYVWASRFENGIWTYDLSEAFHGFKIALEKIAQKINVNDIAAAGISGMMHGYLAFDKNWNLLAPFATWQNTICEEASEILSKEFNFKIPQRWSSAHLYRRVLNGESHVKDVAHITTLAGYVHFMLTGENVIGIGEASGMFPIDTASRTYDAAMAEKYNLLLKKHGCNHNILDLLPKVLVAGESAGRLKNTQIIDNLLPSGIPFVPPEGDMGTGMVATNSVEAGTGNISAGTSFNLTVITGKNLSKVYPELDIITTPTGTQAALVHCNNGTNDINKWFSVLKETAEFFGGNTEDMYTKLYNLSLKGDADCGGVTVYNYMAGEPISHVNEGRPIVKRTPDSNFTLANFVRAQLYGSMATMRLGVEILSAEKVEIKSITGHGGFFKTPYVGQKYMAAACNAPVYCSDAAGEGGPYGMALLAAFSEDKKKDLSAFLNKAFGKVSGTTVQPDKETVEGFSKYMQEFTKGLAMQTVGK